MSGTGADVAVSVRRLGVRPRPTRPALFEQVLVGLLLAVTVIAYLLLFWRQLGAGLEFDESYNLVVVRNLAEGDGYASDGAHQGGGLVPFDPWVSTGPTLLVPAALVWKLSDGWLPLVRVVPLAFFALGLYALWGLGRSVAGRTGAVLALSAPLMLVLAIPDLDTRSLVPGRVVGEFTAASLLLAAALMLVRRHPFLAGLFAGLAVQSKANTVIAGALICGTWAVAHVIGRRREIRPVLLAATGCVLPTAAFELFRLSSLGPEGYLASVRSTQAFVTSQVTEVAAPEQIRRLDALVDALTSPGIVVLALAAVGLLTGVARLAAGRAPGFGPEHLPLVGVATGGLALGWLWVTRSTQDTIRQGLPSLLLVIPMLLLLTVRLNAPAPRREGVDGHSAAHPTRERPWWSAAVVHGLVVLSVLGCAAHAWALLRTTPQEDALDEQRAAAEAILASGTPSIAVDGWWVANDMQLLTGLPPSNFPGASPATVLVYSDIQAVHTVGVPDARVAAEEGCGKVLYSSATVVVCRPSYEQ